VRESRSQSDFEAGSGAMVGFTRGKPSICVLAARNAALFSNHGSPFTVEEKISQVAHPFDA
jgi:hypothetical protein